MKNSSALAWHTTSRPSVGFSIMLFSQKVDVILSKPRPMKNSSDFSNIVFASYPCRIDINGRCVSTYLKWSMSVVRGLMIVLNPRSSRINYKTSNGQICKILIIWSWTKNLCQCTKIVVAKYALDLECSSRCVIIIIVRFMGFVNIELPERSFQV